MPKISEMTAGSPAQTTDEIPARRGTSNVRLTLADVIAADKPSSSTISATTYTIQATDFGKILLFTSASAVTITIPSGLGAGFQCAWKQKGAGQLSFTPGASVTLESLNTARKSSGQYAMGSLIAEAANIVTLCGSITV